MDTFVNLYKAMLERHEKEQAEKSTFLYSISKKTVHATRCISKNVPTPIDKKPQPALKMLYAANDLSPTMFTPWNKQLSTDSSSRETFSRALKSMFAQLFYDIFFTIAHTIIAIPCLITGLAYLGHSFLIEKDKIQQKAQQERAINVFLANVLLTPYFAVSIAVDFLREFCAIFTRTYASVMQTSDEQNSPSVSYPCY